MSFLNRLIGSASTTSRSRTEARSSRRRRAPIVVESLEGRDLKSSIPGVSEQWGMVYIQATQGSNNVATVSIDPGHNNDLRVSLNGNSTWFNASQVWTIGFTGSQG